MRDRLTAALADRYAIERELGAGGMATVYLAEDLKHKRKVALKVLKPELAAVLGAERFVQDDHGEPTTPAHPAAVRFRRGGRVPVLRDAVHRGREYEVGYQAAHAEHQDLSQALCGRAHVT
jgi:serine/threonine protein kinase